MPTRSILRRSTLLGVTGQAGYAPVYVDADDNKLKMIPAGTGSTEVEIVDASTAQTLTNKTLTSPTIATPVLTAPTGFKETIHVPVSFETGFQMTLKLFFPYAVTINKIRAIVTKALAATDSGTITARNAASSAMATGVITITASSALGNAGDGPASPTTNNSIAADANMELVIAKTTAGGEALVSVEFTRA